MTVYTVIWPFSCYGMWLEALRWGGHVWTHHDESISKKIVSNAKKKNRKRKKEINDKKDTSTYLQPKRCVSWALFHPVQRPPDFWWLCLVDGTSSNKVGKVRKNEKRIYLVTLGMRRICVSCPHSSSRPICCPDVVLMLVYGGHGGRSLLYW